MERKFYTNDFERLLKEKSDEFRMYPSKRVWHSIYNDLHPGRKWPSVAMSMLLVIALLLIGYLNTNDNSTKKQVAVISVSPNNLSNTNTGNSATQRISEPASDDQQQTGLAKSANDINASQEIINSNSYASADIASNARTNASTVAGNPDSRFKENVYTDNTIPANNNIVETIDNYIKTNQLFYDIAGMNKQKDLKTVNPLPANAVKDETSTEFNRNMLQNTAASTTIPAVNPTEVNQASQVNQSVHSKNNSTVINSANNANLSAADKVWMEDYALHNKSARAKWKDRTDMEFYVTPGIGYRRLSNNTQNDAAAVALAAGNGTSPINKTVSQKPSLGLEAGFDLSYSFAKNLKLKTGVQLNYTSYGINADETNHPILTTLVLNDPDGRPYLSARTSTLSNSSGLQPVTVHNSTFQFSIPIGIAVKLAGNNNLQWYAGASLQPSFVFGGSAHFISSDYKSYVSDPSLLRKWNLNSGFETYLNYKMGGYTLQAGPQFRYQLLSTYTKQYSLNEKLYNMGLKVGVIKSF